MNGRHNRRGRPTRSVATVAAVLLALLSVGLIIGMTRSGGSKSAAPGRPTVSSSPALTPSHVASPARGSAVGRIPPIPGGPSGPAHAAPPAKASASPPVHLTVPSIGVDSSLESLGLLADKSLAPPTQWGEAGWYAGGVRPGDPGPAVIAGHVDSRNGPAVFFRLRDLRPGAPVYVTTQTGRVLRFLVDTSQQYPKDHFPTEAVYGPTPLPVLRLITCTGAFDAAAHSYLDNLVVTAHLA